MRNDHGHFRTGIQVTTMVVTNMESTRKMRFPSVEETTYPYGVELSLRSRDVTHRQSGRAPLVSAVPPTRLVHDVTSSQDQTSRSRVLS